MGKPLLKNSAAKNTTINQYVQYRGENEHDNTTCKLNSMAFFLGVSKEL